MTDAADNTATQPTSAPRLSDFDGSRDNNFNLIRFLAATAVIFGHSYLIAWGDQQQYEEPIYKLTGWVSGHHAVDVFFATSGFLIMASLFRHPRVSYYVKARALRIYPALLVAVLFCAFIVGPMFTSKSMGEYFASKQVYKFVMANSMLEPFPIQYKLPGVFENAPYSTDDTNPPTGDLNGSLWTLPHEIKAYIGVGLFFFFFVLLRKREKLLPIAFYGLTALFMAYFAYRGFTIEGGLVQDHYRLYAFFLTGGCFYLLRKHIPLHLPLASGLLVASLIAFYFLRNDTLWNTAWLVIMPYILFCLAYLPGGALRRFNKLGDYSYGIYIYAWPIQQIIATWIPGIDPIPMTLITFPVTLCLAVMSWHFIERPCLKRVRSARARAVEAPSAAPASA